MRVLRKKSVTWMNRIHIRDFRRADDAIYLEVTFRTGGFADANGFVGHMHMHRIDIRFGINRHRADVQFLACADNSNRNFSAIGYEDFLEHDYKGRILNNAWPTVA